MAPMYEEEIFALITGLLSGIPSMLLGIATYVLTALAFYTIARRRGLRKPWLAWIPVVNVWLLGSVSDQYRYVVKRENRSKRKSLLILSILMAVLAVAIVVMAIVVASSAIFGSYHYGSSRIWDQLAGIIGLCLPLVGVAIAYAVIRYMALYDVFRSLDPDNCVMFLVLSILFSPTEPFFLFFNRNKDKGMPPRRQEPVYAQEPQWQPAQEPWEQENKDYL